MGQSATAFGKRHGSCILGERMQFDRANPGAGQAGFYEACQNGEYLLWQLYKLPGKVLNLYRKQYVEIARRAAKRAAEYAATATDAEAAAYAGVAEAFASRAARPKYVTFAAAATRATEAAAFAAEAAAAAAAMNAARHKELQRQADDIHQLIPVWPGC